MVVRHKCSEREKWVTQTNKTMLEHELQWQILLVHQFHLRTVLMIYCLPSSIHRLRTSWFDDCVVWFTPPSSYHPWFIDCYLSCIDCYLSIIYLFIVCWLCLFVCCLCFLFVRCYFQCRGVALRSYISRISPGGQSMVSRVAIRYGDVTWSAASAKSVHTCVLCAPAWAMYTGATN